MGQKSNRGTPDEKIVPAAKAWRRIAKAAIADKQDPDKQRAEYKARRDLAKVVDEAGAQR